MEQKWLYGEINYFLFLNSSALSGKEEIVDLQAAGLHK